MSFELSFTAHELQLLDDRLTKLLAAEDIGAYEWQDLMLKLGAEQLWPRDQIYTTDELWAMARAITPLDMVGSEPCGRTAKAKVYRALLGGMPEHPLSNLVEVQEGDYSTHESPPEDGAQDGASTDEEIEPF